MSILTFELARLFIGYLMTCEDDRVMVRGVGIKGGPGTTKISLGLTIPYYSMTTGHI